MYGRCTRWVMVGYPITSVLLSDPGLTLISRDTRFEQDLAS